MNALYLMFIHFAVLSCFSAIDTVLSDILPKNVYFRWNPNMSADIDMDEGRIEMLEQIQFDARRHLEKVDDSLKTCARSLLQSKTVVDRSMDKFRSWYRTTWEIVKNVFQRVKLPFFVLEIVSFRCSTAVQALIAAEMFTPRNYVLIILDRPFG